MENLIILQNKISFMIEQSRNIAISLIYDRKILIIFILYNHKCIPIFIISYAIKSKLRHPEFACHKLNS